MTNLQLLKSVKTCRLEWQRWDVKAQYVKAKCEYPSGGLGGEQTGKTTGGTENKIEFKFCDLADAQDQAAKALRKYREAERQALELIDLLEDENRRMMLRMRYIDFLPVEKIGEVLNFGQRQPWRILKAAIRELESIKPGS